MTSVTPTLIQHTNIPSTVDSGSAERRLTQVYIEASVSNRDDTLDISSYISGFSTIVAAESYVDGAHMVDASANTWSGSTLTFAGSSGTWKVIVTGYMT